MIFTITLTFIVFGIGPVDREELELVISRIIILTFTNLGDFSMYDNRQINQFLRDSYHWQCLTNQTLMEFDFELIFTLEE